MDSLHLLLDKVLLVLRKSHGHDVIVVLDVPEHTFNSVLGVIEDLLPPVKIFQSIEQVEALLHLLDFFLSLLKFKSNVLQARGISKPGILGVGEQLKTSLSLVLGVLPSINNALDMAVQELGFAVGKKIFRKRLFKFLVLKLASLIWREDI